MTATLKTLPQTGDESEALAFVQTLLMEIACTKGIDSLEYREAEKYETILIRRINDDDGC